MSRNEVQTQRSDIAKTQTSVLDRMPPARATKAKRFETIPFLAIEVDPTELDTLTELYDVTSIEEDTLAEPVLAESVPLIEGDTVWNAGYTGSGQTVAILDTGVDKAHPFLSGKVVSEACYSTTYASHSATSVCPGGVTQSTSSGSGVNCSTSIDGCGHGTHVAGIAAGRGTTFSGVAKDAGVIAIQVFSRFDSTTYCGESSPCALSYTSDQIRGLERVYALRSTYNIASINMSLGGGRYYTQSTCDSDNTSIKTAIDNLRAVGIATIIAAGNEGYTDSLSAPGCVSTAISVGSSTKSDLVSSFSNSAYFLNLLAPGGSIQSAVPGTAYATWSGTSMAAPHVAGAWALLKNKTPNLAVGDGLNLLISTGQPVTDTRSSVNRTTPRVDLAAALIDGWIVLPAPSATSATNIGTGSFTATWNGSSGATGYRLDVAADSSFTSYVTGYQNLDVGNANSRSVGGLNSGTTYYYRVRAYDTSATSNNSNTVSVTTSYITQSLTNGMAVSSLSGSTGSSQYYYLDVPSGATSLTVTISGGSGDADLYLRRDATPTAEAWDCRPYLTGNEEQCSISNPPSGRYYVMLYGFSNYSGLTLTAQYPTNLARPETIALYAPSSGTFYLRNSNSAGLADIRFVYGPANAGWIPLAGDWNGNGTTTVGLYNPATGRFYLRNSNTTGIADVSFQYGPANAGWIPLAGDWDGDGKTTIGLYNPATGRFYLRNSNTTGIADVSFQYGPANAGWIPLTGDWDGDGKTTAGLYNPATGRFYLRNSNTSGIADVSFLYGPANAGWKPITADWNGDSTSTIGLHNPGNSSFYLRNTNSTGVADTTFPYGPAQSGWLPLAGAWTVP